MTWAMARTESYDAARGWWRLDGDRAKRERYVLAVGDGYGVQAIEITYRDRKSVV